MLDARVWDELDALPVDMRARFRRIAELIQAYGLEAVREPHVKHLQDPLWEMRMKGRDGISRATYVTARGQRPEGSGGPRVRQEDPEDATAGD